MQDNREVIKTIPDRSIDLILTDPPYNIAKYSTGNIELPNRTPLNNDIANWDKVEVNPEEYVNDFKRIFCNAAQALPRPRSPLTAKTPS